ncbi:hypothetical protein [Nocardia sp. NPDC019304]
MPVAPSGRGLVARGEMPAVVQSVIQSLITTQPRGSDREQQALNNSM